MLPAQTHIPNHPYGGKDATLGLASREPNEQHLKGRMGGRLQVLKSRADGPVHRTNVGHV